MLCELIKGGTRTILIGFLDNIHRSDFIAYADSLKINELFCVAKVLSGMID